MAVYDLIYFNITALFCHCGFPFLFSVICYHTLNSPKLAEFLMDSLAKDYMPLAAFRATQQLTRHDILNQAAVSDDGGILL